MEVVEGNVAVKGSILLSCEKIGKDFLQSSTAFLPMPSINKTHSRFAGFSGIPSELVANGTPRVAKMDCDKSESR